VEKMTLQRPGGLSQKSGSTLGGKGRDSNLVLGLMRGEKKARESNVTEGAKKERKMPMDWKKYILIEQTKRERGQFFLGFGGGKAGRKYRRLRLESG